MLAKCKSKQKIKSKIKNNSNGYIRYSKENHN